MWQILFSSALFRVLCRGLLCSAVGAGVLACAPLVAMGQDGASVGLLVKRAGQYYRRGKQFAIKREFGLALRAYQRALRSVKKAQSLGGTTPKLRHIETTMLYIIAKTFEYRKQWCSAHNFYRRCLRRRPRPGLSAKASGALTALQPRLRFSMQLTSSPPDAAFYMKSLTGQEPWRRVTPMTSVGCGSYQIEARLSGYKRMRKTLDTFGSGTPTLSFTLQPLQGTTPPNNTGNSGSQGDIVKPGARPGGRRWPQIVAWSSVAAAGLMGLGGILMVGIARSEFANVEEKKGDPLESIDQLQSQRDRGVNLQNTGFIFWGLAAAAGGVAIWAFLKQKQTKAAPAASTDADAAQGATLRLSP